MRERDSVNFVSKSFGLEVLRVSCKREHKALIQRTKNIISNQIQEYDWYHERLIRSSIGTGFGDKLICCTEI